VLRFWENHIPLVHVYHAGQSELGLEYARHEIQGEHHVKPLLISRIGILVFVVSFAAISDASARKQTKPPAASVAKPASAVTGSPGAKSLGSKNAPITMEVFEDFQCPACGNFYETSLKQVIDEYVNTGKVYLIHRDFPLDMHPYARQAARLANAAADLGQFETVERALFDSQGQWSANGKIEEALASSVPAPQMKKILDYQAAHINDINAAIERDHTMGVQRKVNQTPTIYVTSHGKTEALPGGGVNYNLLKQYLDFLLRQ
jgi:protein-disulfide isomerase